VELDRPTTSTPRSARPRRGDVDVTIDTAVGRARRRRDAGRRPAARHVEVGNMAGAEITLPAPLDPLRVARRPRLLRRPSAVEAAPRGLPPAHGPRRPRRRRVDVERVRSPASPPAWERQGRAAGGPKTVIVP
jgi:hypothetical protein